MRKMFYFLKSKFMVRSVKKSLSLIKLVVGLVFCFVFLSSNCRFIGALNILRNIVIS